MAPQRVSGSPIPEEASVRKALAIIQADSSLGATIIKSPKMTPIRNQDRRLFSCTETKLSILVAQW